MIGTLVIDLGHTKTSAKLLGSLVGIAEMGGGRLPQIIV